MGLIFIGTSGWQYRHWKLRFYPEDLKQTAWLEHYAAHFQTVEVNNTFYRLPEAATFVDWAKRTPEDFTFALKASRYLSHVRRLLETKEPVARLMDRARYLGPKLGPILLQLPPNLPIDLGRLDDVLAAFPNDVRVAVEFRHPSWFVQRTQEILTEHEAALCLTDRYEREQTPIWKTAAWSYIRLHEGSGSPHPCYRPERLRFWAELIAAHWGDEQDVYVYFNNDGEGCAIRDATEFAGAARQNAMRSTRVPKPHGAERPAS
jgi:uncharacterized protein YecE (DUF72 family)